MMISFGVPCIPIAQPRQRHRVVLGHGRTFSQNYTPAKHPVQDFKATIRLAASQQYEGPPLEGPLGVALVFVLPRPGRLIWKTRPMPRAWHGSKPDAENLAKSVLDALTGLIWRDDSQVSELTLRKYIASGGEQPNVVVTILTLE